MREYRCRRCGGLLFRAEPTGRPVQAKCHDRRCALVQTVYLDAEPARAVEAKTPAAAVAGRR